jgi:hypothetical protein
LCEIRTFSSISRFEHESQKKIASLPRPRPRFRPRFSDLSFHSQPCIHVTVSDLYIPRIGPPPLQQNRQIDGWNINRSKTHECGNWGCGHAFVVLGTFVLNFRYWFFAVGRLTQKCTGEGSVWKKYREGREDQLFKCFRKYFSLVKSQLIQPN